MDKITIMIVTSKLIKNQYWNTSKDPINFTQDI